MGEEVTQFVRDSLSGDAVRATETFHQLMRDKISSRVEALRQTAAASLFIGDGSESVDD